MGEKDNYPNFFIFYFIYFFEILHCCPHFFSLIIYTKNLALIPLSNFQNSEFSHEGVDFMGNNFLRE